MSARQPDAETLLRTEHAVARVLTDAPDEGAAFSRILEAIGSSLAWDTGALWQLDRYGTPAAGAHVRTADTTEHVSLLRLVCPLH